MEMKQQEALRLSSEAVYINNEPIILLCSSLFYFRIPRGLWVDRMKKLKQVGYNCIDVYIPWNYHELNEDQWDFSGERDISEFLKLAAEEGLYVIARPGPYICSEWDGGAIPSYLFRHRNMRLRDNDTLYLSYVKKWYDKIMPVIKKYQIVEQGTILAVQLDNELDFYPCKDIPGYMGALRDMALEHGIQLPLTACSGWGLVSESTGSGVEGLVTTLNIYPHDRTRAFEDRVLKSARALRERNLPACVTETHRDHYLLRRYLACGVKMISPYNQTGGTDFGFTNGVNNNGNPASFQTSNYDFSSMITSLGEFREEYYEACLFSKFIRSMGKSLATALMEYRDDIQIESDISIATNSPDILSLSGGGYLISITNIDSRDGYAHVKFGNMVYPGSDRLKVRTGRCYLLLVHVPLSTWELSGELLYSTAELGLAKKYGNRTIMEFYSEDKAELSFSLPGDVKVNAQGVGYSKEGDHLTFLVDFGILQNSDSLSAEIQFENGKYLQLIFHNRKTASRIVDISDTGEIIRLPEKHPSVPYAAELDSKDMKVKGLMQDNKSAFSFDNRMTLEGKHPRYLEEMGILKGYALYSAAMRNIDQSSIKGFLLKDAGDVLIVYCNGKYTGTYMPVGGSAFIPALDIKGSTDLEFTVRCEIWGHCNFHDERAPGLIFGAPRGLSGISAILNEKLIKINEGSLLNNGSHHIFEFTYKASDEHDAWTLYLPHAQMNIKVSVDDIFIGTINQYSKYVTLDSNVKPGDSIKITLCADQNSGPFVEQVIIQEGINASEWFVAACEEPELRNKYQESKELAMDLSLPHSLDPGETCWLFMETDALTSYSGCWIGLVEGNDLKITVFFNGRIVSRLWLDSSTRPFFKGGRGDMFYMPGPWFTKENNHIAMLIEAVSIESAGVLKKVTFRRVGLE